MLEIIVSQGRVADRSARTMEGAVLTGFALEERYGVEAQFIGDATPPAADHWSKSLVEAKQNLIDLGNAIDASINRGNFPLMVAGTCPASIGSLPVVARNFPEAVVLWIDAHGDFNTPATTESGYLGGMVVSAACGLWDSGHGAGLRPENVVLVGAHDIDSAESALLKTAGVRVLGPSASTPEAVLAAIDGANVWIHIDWDVLEPGYVAADYTVRNGMLPAQLRSIFEALPSTQVLGLEIAEFHPSNDQEKNAASISTVLEVIGPLLTRYESRQSQSGKAN